jgi:hypothetical protein
VLSNHQKFASLSFTELLLLSKNCHTQASSRSVLHQASPSSFSSLSTFRRINAAPLLFIIRAAFTLAHPLTQTSHAQPCSRHGENIRRQNQDDLITPKHTLNARVFTLCRNPLLCYRGFWTKVQEIEYNLTNLKGEKMIKEMVTRDINFFQMQMQMQKKN